VGVSKAEVRSEAQKLGLDLVGFAGKGLILVAKRIPLETIGMRDLVAKQVACGEIMRAVGSASHELATWLGQHGASASPIPPHDPSAPPVNTPAGQASRDIRAAAVACGLGTWGLNMAVLTPQFGSRVFLGAIRADLELEPDPPLNAELCLGLEQCGRCAAICPEAAIPMRAPEGMALRNARGIEAEACMRSAQPQGADAYASTGPAAYTGCIECLQVCPVGEDYAQVEGLPERRKDLPGGVRHIRAGGFVIVEHIGPQIRRS